MAAMNNKGHSAEVEVAHLKSHPKLFRPMIMLEKM